MYTGVPGADLVAFTCNLVWTFRPGQRTGFDPYLVAGLGSYVKFSENRFGLNGGAGVGRRLGSVRLYAELRYHRVTESFEEANEADTFVPLLLGDYARALTSTNGTSQALLVGGSRWSSAQSPN